jgi:hypothetical protein
MLIPFVQRNNEVKKFKLLGERCSGTYYVQRLIERNLDIPHTDELGHKHFWSTKKNGYPEDVLLVFLVRDPYTWSQSFFDKKWHMPEHMLKMDFTTFVSSEIYSVKDSAIPQIAGVVGSEILADRDFYSGKRHENLFKLRANKLDFMLNIFPDMAPNMIVMRYEDFEQDYIGQLNILSKKFDLKSKETPFVNLHHYKGNPDLSIYKKRHLILSDAEKSLVTELSDWCMEGIFGYMPLK